MKRLLEMLTYGRPAGSPTERAFLERYVMPYKPLMMSKNLIVVVPGNEGTLFSCHTDTVHRNHAMQEVIFDDSLKIAYKDDKEPLGADNTAGVWLLTEMLEQGIPGTYVFHYGEEKGCEGSGALAKEHPDWLKKFVRAIAFDRRGTSSIITHQMGTRTCSDVFANALAYELGGSYAPDKTGLYTDTSCYTHLIPECTNVSVGYDHEHTAAELLDVEHILWLRDQLHYVRWDELPTTRMPSKDSARGSRKYFSGWGFGNSYEVYDDATEMEDGRPSDSGTTLTDKDVEKWIDWGLDNFVTEDAIEDLVLDEPYTASTLLWAFLMREHMWYDEYQKEKAGDDAANDALLDEANLSDAEMEARDRADAEADARAGIN